MGANRQYYQWVFGTRINTRSAPDRPGKFATPPSPPYIKPTHCSVEFAAYQVHNELGAPQAFSVDLRGGEENEKSATFQQSSLAAGAATANGVMLTTTPPFGKRKKEPSWAIGPWPGLGATAFRPPFPPRRPAHRWRRRESKPTRRAGVAWMFFAAAL